MSSRSSLCTIKGQVLRLKLPGRADKRYNQTDRSRGFGFITMRTTEDAARAIEKLNGLVLHGRAIRVDYSATQKPHNPTPGEYMGAKRPGCECSPFIHQASQLISIRRGSLRTTPG